MKLEQPKARERHVRKQYGNTKASRSDDEEEHRDGDRYETAGIRGHRVAEVQPDAVLDARRHAAERARDPRQRAKRARDTRMAGKEREDSRGSEHHSAARPSKHAAESRLPPPCRRLDGLGTSAVQGHGGKP